MKFIFGKIPSKKLKAFAPLRLCVRLMIVMLISLSISICVSSCKNDNPITPVQQDTATNFRYPLTENSNWFHTTKDLIFNIRPDSIRYHLSTDTTVENGFTILKNDTVINGITYKILKTDHSSVVHAYTNLEFFRQTDSGLVTSSANFQGTGFGPFRASQSKFEYNGNKFSELSSLILFASGESMESKSVLTEYNCLRFPIIPGEEWKFRKVDEVNTQYKKYLNYETVSSPAGSYNCIKIRRENFIGSTLDTNTILYDYYSRIGMVKRDYLIKNISYLNSMGQVIGYFDIKDEVILNTYLIQ